MLYSPTLVLKLKGISALQKAQYYVQLKVYPLNPRQSVVLPQFGLILQDGQVGLGIN